MKSIRIQMKTPKPFLSVAVVAMLVLVAMVFRGHHVVTASRDLTARVWHAGTGQPVTPALHYSAHLDRHHGGVTPA